MKYNIIINDIIKIENSGKNNVKLYRIFKNYFFIFLKLGDP